MILADWQIRALAEQGMIEPFMPEMVREVEGRRVISFGQGSFGYDIRVAPEWMVMRDSHTPFDPLNATAEDFDHYEGDTFILPPYDFLLARSVEYIRMPRNVTGVVLGKSSYARSGLVSLMTPLEAGWEGHITLEFYNCLPRPLKLYAGEGIAQILFLQGQDPLISYADRAGKYQGQTGITLPRL